MHMRAYRDLIILPIGKGHSHAWTTASFSPACLRAGLVSRATRLPGSASHPRRHPALPHTPHLQAWRGWARAPSCSCSPC